MVKRVSKKAAVWIAIIIAVLLTAGTAAYIFRVPLLNLFGVTIYGVNTTDTGPPLEEAEIETTITAAETFVGRGDTEAATKLIDNAIAKTGSSEQKASLYEKKASIIAESDVDGAIEAMEEAVAVNPGFETYSYLALLYERTGDYAKAAEFYDKSYDAYLEEFPDKPAGQIDANLFKEKADEMESKL